MYCFMCQKELSDGEPRFRFEEKTICAGCNAEVTNFTASVASRDCNRIVKSIEEMKETAKTAEAAQVVSDYVEAQAVKDDLAGFANRLQEKDKQIFDR